MESNNYETILKGELGAEYCYQDTSREEFGKSSHDRGMVESENGLLPSINQGFDRTYPVDDKSPQVDTCSNGELRFLPPPIFIRSPKKISKNVKKYKNAPSNCEKYIDELQISRKDLLPALRECDRVAFSMVNIVYGAPFSFGDLSYAWLQQYCKQSSHTMTDVFAQLHHVNSLLYRCLYVEPGDYVFECSSSLFAYMQVRDAILKISDKYKQWASRRDILYERYTGVPYGTRCAQNSLFWVDREDLVGIEHNPGPDQMLIKYLKNMDRLPDRASTRKRSEGVPKLQQRYDKLRRKRVDLVVNQQRLLKYSIEPQGIMEFGIDAESKGMIEAFTKTIQEFVAKFPDLREEVVIKHETNFGFVDLFHQIYDYISKLGKQALDFFIGIIKTISVFFQDSMRKLLFAIFNIPQCECAEGRETIFDLMDEIDKENTRIEVQMDTPVHLLSMLLYREHFMECMYEGDWRKFFNTVCELKKSAMGGKSFIDVFTALAKEIAILMSDLFGIDVPFLGYVDPIVKELQLEAKSLTEEYRNGIKDDYEFADRVHLLVDTIESLLMDKRKTVSHDLKERLNYMLKKFNPVVQYAERNLNPANGPRVEPLAILIAGPSGVGKSTVTTPFLLALLGNVLPEDKKQAFMKNHNDFLFFRASVNEYWEGYKMRHAAVVYDDFGQLRDSVGSPNMDAYEVIRLKNTAPYHLHYASLEDKSRNYAHPKVIFASTNLSRLHFSSLHCNEAVTRRFDLSYVQVPKLEFCVETTDTSLWSRRLDIDKVRQKYPYDGSNPSTFAELSVIEFIPWDFANGVRADGPSLSFDAFLKMAIATYRRINGKGEAMLKYHTFMKQYVPQMDTESEDTSFYEAPDYGEIDPEKYCDKDWLEEDKEDERKYRYRRKWEKFKTLMHMYVEEMSTPTYGKYLPSSLKPSCEVYMWLRRAAIVSCGIAGAVIAWKVGSSVVNRIGKALFGEYAEPQYEKKEVKISKILPRKVLQRRNVALDIKKVTVEGQLCAEDFNPYQALLKRSMYRLDCNGQVNGWALAIAERIFLIPRHFDGFYTSNDSDEVRIQFKNIFSEKVCFEIDWMKDIDVFDEHVNEAAPPDYLIFRINSNKCREHADIRNYFPKASDILRRAQYRSMFSMVREKNVIMTLPTVQFDPDKSEQYPWEHLWFTGGDISYYAPLEKGDCGAPILTCDPRFGRPTILGIHVAAHISSHRDKLCLGKVICRSILDRAIECFKHPQDDGMVEEEIPCEEGVEIQGFCALAKMKCPTMPNTTNLIPSEMKQYLWENTMKPAYLRPFRDKNWNLVDPLVKAREGYSHDEVYIDSANLRFAANYVSNLICRKEEASPWEPRVFSFEEAVVGVPGVDFVDSINRNSSPGYPYVIEGHSKKKLFFGDGPEYDLNTRHARELKSKINEYIREIAEGKRKLFVYLDYLKDEKRPIAKVDSGKTRQFMAGPLDYLVLMRMYFGDFNRFICANRIRNGICIGINPYDEWDTLASYLGANDPRKFVTAGDYSKFDARIPVPIAYAVLDIVERFYSDTSTPIDRRIRRVLFLDIVNSLHLSQGKLYEFVGGNPSGQPLTSVFNSIANLLMLAYNCVCTIKAVDKPLAEAKKILERTRFAVYGDDNIVSYYAEDHFVWGQEVLESTMPKYVGMSYTNEMKDVDAFVSKRKLSDVQFLKRGFLFLEDRWRCPLDMGTLKETLLWRKKKFDEEEMHNRISAVLSELALHGREVYYEYAPKIVSASMKAYHILPFGDNYDDAFYNGTILSYN